MGHPARSAVASGITNFLGVAGFFGSSWHLGQPIPATLAVAIPVQLVLLLLLLLLLLLGIRLVSDASVFFV